MKNQTLIALRFFLNLSMLKRLFLSLLLIYSCSSEEEEPAPPPPPVKYTLTTAVNPAEGGTITPASGEYNAGTTVTVTASPAAEYVFKDWTGATGTTASTSVVMSSNKSVTANFIKKQYPLTVEVDGEGSVEEEVIKQGLATDYNSGTVVKLTAIPKGEWLFVEWKGDLTGSENPQEITIDKAKTVTAVFVKKQYTLTIEIEGEGSVKKEVIKQGLSTDYNSGTIIKLKADPKDNWRFVEWKGDLTGSENPQEITIDKSKTVTAIFSSANPFFSEDNCTVKARDWAEVGDSFEFEFNGVTDTYTVVDSTTLKNMISSGKNVSYVVTSKITNMDELFLNNTNFNDDISRWDVSNVNSMKKMFEGAKQFNQNIGCWDVSKVENMGGMFRSAVSFNQNLGDWKTNSVQNMQGMFVGAENFNQDLNSWDVSNVTHMGAMFAEAINFNGNISSWDVSKVEIMGSMFYRAIKFNQDISSWNTSNVTTLNTTFSYAESFNQDLNSWDVSNVISLHCTFDGAKSFNSDLNNWDVSNVTTLNGTFRHTDEFNGNISNWDVSNVTYMNDVFAYTKSFNGDISSWNTSNVRQFSYMFNHAEVFNQDISFWDISSVKDNEVGYGWEKMKMMFYNAVNFNKDISSWCVEGVTRQPDKFAEVSGLQNSYKPLWGKCPVDIRTVTVSLSTSNSSTKTENGVTTTTYNVETQLNNGWKYDIEVLRIDIQFPDGSSDSKDNVKGVLNPQANRKVTWTFDNYQSAIIKWIYKDLEKEYEVVYSWKAN